MRFYPTGNISPFTKVPFILRLLLSTYPTKWFCEIRGHAIGVVSVVVVGVAVRVDIAEVVAVVVVSRPLPPIRCRTNKFYRNVPTWRLSRLVAFYNFGNEVVFLVNQFSEGLRHSIQLLYRFSCVYRLSARRRKCPLRVFHH